MTLRMEELLSKRRAAAMRGLPDIAGDITQNNVEWSAVEEGFRLLERDLGKLQVVTLGGRPFYPSSQIAAIRRNQRPWIPQNSQEIRQTVKVNNKRALSRSTSRCSTRLQSAGGRSSRFPAIY